MIIDRTLVDELYPPAHQTFLKEENITHHRILVLANKDPAAAKTPDVVIARILEILLTKSNQPVLVHCNKGKVSFKRLSGQNHS